MNLKAAYSTLAGAEGTGQNPVIIDQDTVAHQQIATCDADVIGESGDVFNIRSQCYLRADFACKIDTSKKQQ
jgi:hypothetical protein